MLCTLVNRIPLPGIAQLLGLSDCLWRGVPRVACSQFWGEGDRTPLGCLMSVISRLPHLRGAGKLCSGMSLM